ncbi:hypothetical protein B0H65DRAFT_555509 [Neurospora tetraspora]|uniref:C2H2-type domain-containing protein n=1 Tax=Neurospora tetraspora TaxID=94610 RepID=A0AAE0JIQ6_9PEZI|nr:hypothetical protein B0H65DRAFT_555509 [Neurospora tetraspora]
MPPTDTSRKRPSDGGPEDARPHKRRSQGAPAASSSPASAEESDPPALTSLADGSRRYGEFKGDIGDGIHRTLSGGGALFPTNYKLDIKYPSPWICPLYNCRIPFDQCSNLGRHFSKAHRGLKLYDEEERGFFHTRGMRTNPDKDGRFRPIVVDRGFRAPGRQDDRQAPAASAAATATALSPSTAARAVNSSVSTLTTPAQAARPSSRNVIDLSSDNEDVKPVVKGTPVGNTASRFPAQREKARGETKNTGTANRVNNPQELGGAQHHRNIFASWRQEAGAQHLEDSSSTSNSEDDDDSDPFDFEPSNLPVLRKNATQQQETSTDTSPIVLADSKQPSDPSKSAIWRYLMTLTKTEIPVPDDPAITELLTLPKRRDLPKTWQNRVSKFEDFHLTTLTALVLYIGGDEASNSPCKWMGCSVQTEIEFNRGSWIDYMYAFPKCVFLPVPISERLGHHLCCNAYHRGWKKEAPWKNMVPNEQIKAARHAERAEVMKNASTSINKSAGTSLSTNTPSTMPNTATLTSKAGNDAVQLSLSQTSLPGCPPLQPATMVRDTTTHRGSAQQATSQYGVTEHTGNKSGLESSPVNPNVETNKWLNVVRDKTRKKTKGEGTRQKEDLGVEQQHSLTSQAQVTPVSSAAASLSNLTMQDTSTAPSTSQQQSRSENSQEAAIFNPANKSPQFLGLQGEETQLLQASRRHTLECMVVAGSMKVKIIKNGGMAITSRVDASKTWTVDPDSQCLVSNFFPAAQEVAVLKVKSQPVLASKE